MSATNRGAGRRLRDAYPTPAWCLHRLLERRVVYTRPGLRLLEPCAGEGALIRAWKESPDLPEAEWHAWEVSEECLEPLEKLGAEPAIGFVQALAAGYRRKIEEGLAWPFDAAITNPPFDLADSIPDILDGVALTSLVLLRLNTLRPTRERRWPITRTPNVYVLPNRPCFTGDGKVDATEYAWFEFPGTSRWIILSDTPKEERSTRIARIRLKAGAQ
ncbi:MAG: hypothetical protein HC882_02390 [Acidobacteria bacterium]|nr:hypothetical protein [Acidobacteriota bacterium]